MDDRALQVWIVYRDSGLLTRPYGIRNGNGFLLFFPEIPEFPGQHYRYVSEVAEQDALAIYILESLLRR